MSYTTDYALAELFYDVARISRHIPDDMAPYAGQYRCMLLLDKLETASQKDLAEAMQIRPASLSELLYKLEKKNFIQRIPSRKDKRVLLVSLTPSGKEELAQFEKKREKARNTLVSSLTPEEKQQLCLILEKIRDDYQKGESHDSAAY